MEKLTNNNNQDTCNKKMKIKANNNNDDKFTIRQKAVQLKNIIRKLKNFIKRIYQFDSIKTKEYYTIFEQLIKESTEHPSFDINNKKLLHESSIRENLVSMLVTIPDKEQTKIMWDILFKYYGDKLDLNHCCILKIPLIVDAVRYKDFNLFEHMLKYKNVNINAGRVDNYGNIGNTAFIECISWSKLDFLKLLLKREDLKIKKEDDDVCKDSLAKLKNDRNNTNNACYTALPLMNTDPLSILNFQEERYKKYPSTNTAEILQNITIIRELLKKDRLFKHPLKWDCARLLYISFYKRNDNNNNNNDDNAGNNFISRLPLEIIRLIINEFCMEKNLIRGIY